MILIFGCGIFGRHLLCALAHTPEPILAVTSHTLPERLSSDNVRRLACDVRSERDLARLAEACGGQALTVFYFAARHNIDAVFDDPAAAREVNVDGLRRFLSCGLDVQKLFFASTDCVYGENDADHLRFSESDPLRPVNEYGAQKAEAETIVREHGFTVLRFPFLVGPSLCDRPNFYDTSVRKLQCGEPIEMIDGMTRSALGYPAAARILTRLSALDLPRGETLNVCGDRGYTKYEIGRLIAEKHGCAVSLVQKLTMQQGARFFREKRADCACMDNEKLKRLLQIERITLEV